MWAGGPMSLLDMKDYNAAARRYWWSVTVLGYLALGYSIHALSAYEWPVMAQALAGAAVAAVVALFPVRIPGTKTSIAGGEIFIFLTLLLFGIEAGILAAALEGLVGSWRTSKRWTSRIGTPAMASVAMLAAGSLLELARGYMPGNGWGKAAMLASLLVFGVLYF